MIYSLDKFLVVSQDGKNIYFKSDDNSQSYVVQTFKVGAVFSSNNLLKIKQIGTDNIISLPFSSSIESKLATEKLQQKIDEFRERVPHILERGMKNYVDDLLDNLDLSPIYATLSTFQDNFDGIYVTLSTFQDNFDGIYVTLSTFQDNFDGIYATLSTFQDNFDGIYATLSSIDDFHIIGLSFSGNDLNLFRNDGNTFSITLATVSITGDFNDLINVPDGSKWSGVTAISRDSDVDVYGRFTVATTSFPGEAIFRIEGSAGELFTIVDSLTGSLFSVNDISGLPVLEVFDDSTILFGDYLAPGLLTTKYNSVSIGISDLYSISTDDFDATFMEYVLKSGSNLKTGTIIATWDDTQSFSFSESSVVDIGDTSDVSLGFTFSGNDIKLQSSVVSGSWLIKTIIRSI